SFGRFQADLTINKRFSTYKNKEVINDKNYNKNILDSKETNL
ncbi:44136_t:CDS:2, partial [Gigaspora margarita]